MFEVKWIKIMSNVFDNQKIRLLEAMPEGDTLIVIWFKLLMMAAKTNDCGLIYITPDLPYTDEMLAAYLGKKQLVVKLALDTFMKFGMIDMVDDIVHVCNWDKYQSLSDEKQKEKQRLRTQKCRERKKLLEKENSDSEAQSQTESSVEGDFENGSRNVTLQNVTCNVLDKDIDKDKDIYIESKDSICTSQRYTRQVQEENSSDSVQKNEKKDSKKRVSLTKKDIKSVIDAWNSLSIHGVNQIRDIKPETNRYKALKCRIAEYSIEDVLEAIKTIAKCDFLLGKTEGSKGSSFLIDFDWFVRPNNFPKVLEGNYINKDSRERQYMKDERVLRNFSYIEEIYPKEKVDHEKALKEFIMTTVTGRMVDGEKRKLPAKSVYEGVKEYLKRQERLDNELVYYKSLSKLIREIWDYVKV